MKNDLQNGRTSVFPIHEIFLKRWSSRAFSGETISEKEILTLFEAARWAPSSSNSQPWRFLVATRDSEEWPKFFNLLVEFNQAWAKQAAALVVIVSHQIIENSGKLLPTHSFDTGSAFENLALQAAFQGIIAHGMAGFDYEKARSELKIPENYTVEAMIAIGKPGKKEDLPEDLQKREVPSERKPLSEIIFKGEFGNNWQVE